MNWERCRSRYFCAYSRQARRTCDGIHFQFLAAELLVDLDLDGQAVTVPAGNVRGVESGHGPGLDDEVLEGLVERVAEVDCAVGVGRSVVQDVTRALPARARRICP